ncbi:hypothetical protein HID58_058555 [Brassica napus]|uniref:Uncharacterized protein n=1 Tax=Brassica napus TaxID=3708 RepID=A0ABQ7ZQH9_BRANA|nr:hypothetical protein HID58_058555 [Brassica napus]
MVTETRTEERATQTPPVANIPTEGLRHLLPNPKDNIIAVVIFSRDTCRQGNGGRVFVRAKSYWDRDRHFSSLSFSVAAIERAILLSTAHLLRDGSPVDESPPKSSPLDRSPPEASLGGSHHRSLGASPSLSILSAVLLADLSTVLFVIRRKDDLWSLPDPEHTIKAERVKETTAKQRGKERLREKESPPDAGTRRHALSGPELEWIYFSSLVERV